MRVVNKNLCPATISASIMAVNMWKNSLKNVESDNNKILYETLLDFFTAKRYLLSEQASYIQDLKLQSLLLRPSFSVHQRRTRGPWGQKRGIRTRDHTFQAIQDPNTFVTSGSYLSHRHARPMQPVLCDRGCGRLKKQV